MKRQRWIAISSIVAVVIATLSFVFSYSDTQSGQAPDLPRASIAFGKNVSSDKNPELIVPLVNSPKMAAPPRTDDRRFEKVEDGEVRKAALTAYEKLPLHFEANQGQIDPEVRFLSRGRHYTLFLSAAEAVLTLQHDSASDNTAGASVHEQAARAEGRRSVARHERHSTLRMKFLGANSSAEIIGEEPLRGKSNYLHGSDLERWYVNVPQFAKVRYLQIYPGIDLVYYGNQGSLEYDFVVRPGANPKDIAVEFEGADHVSLDASGDLVLTVSTGEVRFRKPYIYQRINDEIQEIPGGYAIDSNSIGGTRKASRVSFELASHYDLNQTLVIDPILAFSKRTGGREGAAGYGIAVDDLGHAYVTGYTNSLDFPFTEGALQPVHQGGFNEVFVMKLSPDGSEVVYSTFLGGSGQDFGYGIALDTSGNAYITGETNSPNFPVTPGAFQSVRPGPLSAFVAKLNSDGTALSYSTYLGGDTWERGKGIAVDQFGNAYVAGSSASSNFPTTDGAFQTQYAGNGDAFVSKLSANGSLVYSTYLGGAESEGAYGVAVDSSGNVLVTGYTGSFDFPISPHGAFADYLGWGDAFVTKLNSSGSALIYSTYLGGSRSDIGNAIVVDASGNAYITGETESLNFPTTQGSFQPLHTCSPPTTSGWCADAFVTKLGPSGTIVYSTFLGGRFTDKGYGIAVDAFGNAYVTGETFTAMITMEGLTPSGFPVTEGSFQPVPGQVDDGFVTKLNPTGSAIVYSSHLGGNGTDRGYAIAVDIQGNAYVTGWTGSGAEFPTWPEGVWLPSLFITKVSPSFHLVASDLAVSEGDGAAVLTVIRSGSTEGEVTVEFTTSDDTAQAGSDYSAISGVLTFADGETSKLVTVTLLDDAVSEGNESFRVSLRNPSGSFGLGAPQRATVTIHDDDFEELTDYFPASLGDVWRYQVVEDGSATEIAVVAQNFAVNGVMTSVFRNSADGSQEFYSLDGEGLRLHRLLIPDVRIDGLGRTDVTLTFQPPVTFAGLLSGVGHRFASNGVAETNPLGRIGIIEFPYNAEFLVSGLDRITVPAGTFDVLRLAGTLTFAGDLPQTLIFELAEDIGVVRTTTEQAGITRTLELIETNVAPFSVEASTLPDAEIGVMYRAPLSIQGASPPFKVSVAAGSLPGGLTLSESGEITGTPTSRARSANFTVRVSQNGSYVLQPFRINVVKALQVKTKSLKRGNVGRSYDVTVKLSGGRAPYQWSLSGSLPAGLMFDTAAGRITGVPVEPGSFPLTVRVTDPLGGQAQKELMLTIR